MAKRRNLKKEKAERNKAYARQFRKTATKSFFRNKRNNQNSNSNQDSDSTDDQE